MMELARALERIRKLLPDNLSDMDDIAWQTLKEAVLAQQTNDSEGKPCEWYQHDEYCTHPDRCKW